MRGLRCMNYEYSVEFARRAFPSGLVLILLMRARLDTSRMELPPNWIFRFIFYFIVSNFRGEKLYNCCELNCEKTIESIASDEAEREEWQRILLKKKKNKEGRMRGKTKGLNLRLQSKESSRLFFEIKLYLVKRENSIYCILFNS